MEKGFSIVMIFVDGPQAIKLIVRARGVGPSRSGNHYRRINFVNLFNKPLTKMIFFIPSIVEIYSIYNNLFIQIMA